MNDGLRVSIKTVIEHNSFTRSVGIEKENNALVDDNDHGFLSRDRR